MAVLNENGEPEMERVEYVVPRFRVTTVFDVSQTDGEPIPSLEVNELTASVKDYALLTAAIEQVSPVPMRFDEIEGDAKGYYSDADKEICIQVGMGEEPDHKDDDPRGCSCDAAQQRFDGAERRRKRQAHERNRSRKHRFYGMLGSGH